MSGTLCFFDPTEQKLHETLDVLQKAAKEAFEPEAQKFIDKAIYAKMRTTSKNPQKGVPRRQVVQRYRSMRLNGLGSPHPSEHCRRSNDGRQKRTTTARLLFLLRQTRPL